MDLDVCCHPGPELAARARLRRTTSAPWGLPVKPTTLQARRYADLLVIGSIVTLDPMRPEAGAVAVSEGRIVALGDAHELEGLRGPDTEVLDAGADVVFPGFVEPHMHVVPTALFDRAIDCSPFANRRFDDVVQRLKSATIGIPPGAWVIGRGFDPSLFPGEPVLVRDVLDEVAPAHPVAVLNASMHFLYVNSLALTIAGLSDDTPDPAGGVFYRQDGRLNGVLGERGAMARVLPHLPILSPQELDRAVVRVLDRAAAHGITQVHDAATGAVFGVAELGLLQQLRATGHLPVRVSASLMEDVREDWESTHIVPGAGDDWVRAVSWKIISDGSNQGYSGFQRVPYRGQPGRGRPNLDEDELSSAIRRAHRAGWQVMVHANGDAAIDLVLAAYRRALEGLPAHDQRHRVEHCSLAHDGQLAEMSRLGLSPSFLMNHVYYWGRAFRDIVLGPERAALLDPVASAVAHGLRTSFHSDHSVSPLGALRHVQTAVTRQMRDGGEVLNAEERVDVDTALRGVTVDAAWQVHVDDRQGSLKVGHYADLAVLAADPRQVEPDAIADIAVHETWIAGIRAWQAS